MRLFDRIKSARVIDFLRAEYPGVWRYDPHAFYKWTSGVHEARLCAHLCGRFDGDEECYFVLYVSKFGVHGANARQHPLPLMRRRKQKAPCRS